MPATMEPAAAQYPETTDPALSGLKLEVEKQKQRLELARLTTEASALAAPWWRRAGTVTVLTSILASAWPAATLVTGLFEKARAETAENRRTTEAVRTQYLDRLKHEPVSEAELANPALLSRRRIDQLRANERVLRFLTETSSDDALKTWAGIELGKVNEDIKTEEAARQKEEAAANAAAGAVGKLDEAFRLHPKDERGGVAADRSDAQREAQLRKEARQLRTKAAEDYRDALAQRASVQLPVAPLPTIPVPAVRPRILWVDDEPPNNSDIADLLEDNGASVIISTSNKDAKKRLSMDPTRFDLVISDQGRPREGLSHAAFDLLDWLEARGAHLPVIVFSARANTPEEKTNARMHRAFGSTNRPSELLRLVEGAITGFRIAPVRPPAF